MAKPLRIALTKGRLEKDTVGLLERLGYDCTAVREKGRRLILPIPDGNMEVVLAKANDVITYVEHGVCDMALSEKIRSLKCRASSSNWLTWDSADASSPWRAKREPTSTAVSVSSALQQSIRM